VTGQQDRVQAVADLANDAAEAIRSLNHATFPGADGLRWPFDAYDVLASMTLLTARLPQLLGQLDRWLTGEVEAGRVVVAGGDYADDPQAAAAVASHWLDHARINAAALHHALDAAQQAVAYMSASDPDDLSGDDPDVA
jgi:hypothetical protein